jgi:hypothetical protein
MEKQNFFTSFYRIFYSKEFYKEVASAWKSQAFWFLLIIIIISLINTSVKMITGGNEFIKNQAPEMINKIPAMTIKNGTMEIDKKSPYVIELDNKNIAVFDMDNKYNTIEESNSIILIKPDRMIYKNNDIETREYRFSTIKNFAINKEKIQNWLKMMPLIYFAIILLMIAGILFISFIEILINSIAGIIVSKIQKIDLKYGQIVKLSTVTACIGIIISIIMKLFNFSFKLSWLVLFLISIAYLTFAIISNKPEKIEPAGAVPENTEQPKTN